MNIKKGRLFKNKKRNKMNKIYWPILIRFLMSKKINFS